MSLPIMPTQILIVGAGGREHALAWKLAHEPGVNRVVVAPGSGAIAEEPRVTIDSQVEPLDGPALVRLGKGQSVELAIIGPEAPLAAGVADALRDAGIPTFGPSREAARIESSKAFCHEVAGAAGIRMAGARVFAAREPAREFATDLAARGRGLVVKADGLAGGKGVFVCDDFGAAERALEQLFATDGANAVVIEERLAGREASVIVLSDGRECVALPAARDHKRLEDGDRGPNTGGMGAYSPVPDLPDRMIEEIVATIHRPALAELARRGTPFVGALYAGLMLTADGPVLLEFNARFGDPETQVVLPRLAIALGPLLLACARGRLGPALGSLADDRGFRRTPLPAVGSAAVGIVLAADGYPGASRTGDAIEGLDGAAATGALVFHSGTARDPSGTWRTNGGRILTIVDKGPDVAAARAAAEHAADAISFPGLQRRRDIALDLPEALAAAR
jgi:phosphoribosylamine--glycine ligase